MAYWEWSQNTQGIEISGQPGISAAELDRSEGEIGMPKRQASMLV
jgi:hypothetical protein